MRNVDIAASNTNNNSIWFNIHKDDLRINIEMYSNNFCLISCWKDGKMFKSSYGNITEVWNLAEDTIKEQLGT